MNFPGINLSHYIYGLIFFVLVIVGAFVFFYSKNTYKTAIASLIGTLGGFGIGTVIPGFTVKAAAQISTDPQYIHGLPVIDLVITTETPSVETITLMTIVGALIGLIMILYFLNDKDIRHASK